MRPGLSPRGTCSTEAEQRSNVIYKDTDRLSGHAPIDFLRATRPIVVIDEPQSVDNTDEAQDAIKGLNPLCTLRYSATHKNPHNLVYRLDPVRAFDLKLVKQIVVASVRVDDSANEAFVRVEDVDNRKGIKARLRIHVQAKDGPKEKVVTAKKGDDIFELSRELECYRQGFSITEISADPENSFVRFTDRVLRRGEDLGGVRPDVWRAQIRDTVRRHLEKELQVRDHGIKVLSLLFIDRVANYRGQEQDGGKGKFAVAMEEALQEFAKEVRFQALAWLRQPLDQMHNGYLPLTAIAKLTCVVDGREVPIGRTEAQALHGALVASGMLDASGRLLPAFDARREGFSLGLPAEHAGLAPAVTDLLAAYQIERHIQRDRKPQLNRLRKEVQLSPEFRELWDRIKARTTYRVEFDTSKLVMRAADEVRRMPRIESRKVHVASARIDVTKAGTTASALAVRQEFGQVRPANVA